MRIYYYLFSHEDPKPIGGPYIGLPKLATAIKRARRKRPVETLRIRRIVQGRWSDLTSTEVEALLALLD